MISSAGTVTSFDTVSRGVVSYASPAVSFSYAATIIVCVEPGSNVIFPDFVVQTVS